MDKLSRRDFLKTAGVVVGGAVLTAAGVEVGNDPHFINDLKVADELITAQKSKDPERVLESHKLLLAWVFAESVSKFGEAAGFPRSKLTLDHYLYGNGRALDISQYLSETVNSVGASNFVSKMLSEQERVIGFESGKPLRKATEEILSQLRSKDGLNGGFNPADPRQDIGLFYAFGSSTYKLKAPEVKAEFQNQSSIITFNKGLDISLSDRYDWEVNFPIGLSKKAGIFSAEVGGNVFDWFYKSRDLVEPILNRLNLPESLRQNILKTYSDQAKANFAEKAAEISSKYVGDTVRKLTGSSDLVEADLALLKKIGAKDYDMSGSMHVNGPLDVMVSE